MIPTPNSTGFLRSCLTFAFVLGLTVASYAADVYLLPGAAGNGSGSNFANAMAATQLQTTITNLQAGETIYLGSGSYSQNMITITGSGTASLPKRIIGQDTGSGPPLFVGNNNIAVGVSNPKTNPSNYLFRFTGAASYWEFKNLRARDQGFVFTMDFSGSTFTLRSHLTFEDIYMESIEDGIRISNAEHILVKNCTVFKHTKKAFRISNYTRSLIFDSCNTDATGGDPSFIPRNIPVGFGGDDTDRKPIIYDLRFVNCVARRNGYPQPDAETYWNGDGFSTERGTYNVTFTRCHAYDNNDGGFDNKAENVLFDNCISLRNKKGWRIWGSTWLINSIGAYSRKGAITFPGLGGSLGGNSSAEGLQIDPDGFALIDGGTFHNNDAHQFGVGEGGYGIEAYNVILSLDSSSPSGAVLVSGPDVTLVDSIRYKYLSEGTDPHYLSASSGWVESSDPDGFNNDHSPSKGYFGQDAASTLPTAPANLDATLDPTSPRRINLTWTDKSTNERNFLVERSTNNVTFSQIGLTGTKNTIFTDFSLSPSTTYYYRVRATNSVGNSSASNTDSVSTPALTVPTSPIGLTVETNLGDRDVPPGGTVLIWTDRANNEDTFLIERSTDNVNFTQIGTQVENVPTYTDPTVSQATVYYYRVRAANATGNSAYSNSAMTTAPSVYVKDDNDATGITIVGAWTVVTPSASSESRRYGATYRHDANVPGGKSVTFTPTLGVAGNYQVYSWWPGASNRATNVPVDITHSGGTSTVTVNQRPDLGSWYPIGTYNFSAGASGNLKVRNDSTNGFVMADAALFITAPVVPNAPTSLSATAVSESQINLSWTDNSNIENSYVIEYSSDNVTFSRAGSVNANTTTFSCTNLAGGITYYLRVRANGGGGYSGYSNTASTFTLLTLIKDNADANGVTFTGGWTATSLTSGYYGSNYHHDGNTGGTGGKSVRFTPFIPETGDYEVWVRWTAGSNRASNAPYDVVHAGGTTTFSRSQKYNNGTWMLLDTFTFNAGTAGSVLLRNDGADGYVIADAVRFIRVSP